MDTGWGAENHCSQAPCPSGLVIQLQVGHHGTGPCVGWEMGLAEQLLQDIQDVRWYTALLWQC